MEILEKTPNIFTIIILFDPVAIEKVSIDKIKSSTLFNFTAGFGSEIIVLKSNKSPVEAEFHTTKLEYVDRNTVEFEKRSLEELGKLLKSLPDISVKAIGINLFLTIKIGGEKTTAEYIRDTFLKDTQKLEKKLGKTIIQNSTRIFYGSPNDYYDLRLTPISFSEPDLGVQLHYHKDIHIIDTDKLIKMIKEFFEKTLQELGKVTNILEALK